MNVKKISRKRALLTFTVGMPLMVAMSPLLAVGVILCETGVCRKELMEDVFDRIIGFPKEDKLQRKDTLELKRDIEAKRNKTTTKVIHRANSKSSIRKVGNNKHTKRVTFEDFEKLRRGNVKGIGRDL